MLRCMLSHFPIVLGCSIAAACVLFHHALAGSSMDFQIIRVSFVVLLEIGFYK
jgi:hypothetical protein